MNPQVFRLVELADTTAATIAVMANVENAGKTLLTRLVPFGKNSLTINPKAIGRITTWIMLRNIAIGLTSTVVPTSNQVRNGVMTGASRVDMPVIPTLKARSPPARYVMTLLAVPPGQQPTRATPTASSAGKWKVLANVHARSGMMLNWATHPMMISLGREKTILKS